MHKAMIIRLIGTRRGLCFFSLVILAMISIFAPKTGVFAQETETPTETLTATFTGAWHGYILVTWTPDLVLAISQRPRPTIHPCKGCPEETPGPTLDPITITFEGLAPKHGSWPPYLLQIRYNLTHTAAIIEARFDTVPSQENILNLLAQRADMLPAAIGDFQIVVFGQDETGKLPTWVESLEACTTYLLDHSVEWEAPYVP